MQEFLIASVISVLLITLSIAVFYEVLAIAWARKERFKEKPRLMIYHLVVAIFIAHTICVWLYGIAYWLLVDWFALGDLHATNPYAVVEGAPRSIERLLVYVYFSVICYSSVGFGDLAPGGVIRLMSGIEALNGLLLIGWSVTYTYFAADTYLAFDTKRRKK